MGTPAGGLLVDSRAAGGHVRQGEGMSEAGGSGTCSKGGTELLHNELKKGFGRS